ncbi:MAG: LuxR C-terminal-related transcriptional regulator [Clostridiales bacterium]|nr:LuxR C-terminal-related transcriptional regulator [Clostridiales bacterium]
MLAARGWTNKEIGAHLHISTNTVGTQVTAIMQKLGISRRTDLSEFMLK